MINSMRVLCGRLQLSSRGRPVSDYVRKIRTLEHWAQSDSSLSMEFQVGRFALMVDRRPLVAMNSDKLLVNLRILEYAEMKQRLADYGLSVDMASSVLLDAVKNNTGDYTAVFGSSLRTAEMPDDSPISIDKLRSQLAATLGGTFMDLRRAMLTLENDRDRNLLAKMHSLTRWSRIYRRCPKCASALRMRVSKTAAACMSCDRVYYPTYAPVAICVVSNRENTHALLIRHQGTVNTVYTAIAGFANMGESLEETVRREVAEEVGIECDSVEQLNMSQSWPIPQGSLMCGFRAVADSRQKIEMCADELDAARWFSREDVALAYENTVRDPQLIFTPRNDKVQQELKYIPPQGAIAHRIIKHWLDEKSS
uniref:NAD(+) diphosphatase n=1 Tax=Parascaris univalens TaxID=6257 RepID=A0A914ZUG7_PARUN